MIEGKPIEIFGGMDILDRVDLWLNVPASPRSRGWADAVRVGEAYRKDGKWFHNDNGKETELYSPYITHWMPLPAPPHPPHPPRVNSGQQAGFIRGATP